ncbi:hypothetical protein DPSP01_012982 [Paraphaeosphaeria sporulosa]
MTSSSDDSSVTGLSEALLKAENELKELVSKGNNYANKGTFQVWPADHQGTKYLAIHFQFTSGGASYPIMMVGVSETTSLVGQAVAFARDRTRASFSFQSQSSVYYIGAIEDGTQKIYLYHTNHQGTTTSAGGPYTLDSLQQAGALRDWFVQLLRHNALGRTLQID